MTRDWRTWCALTTAWLLAGCSVEDASPDAWAPSDTRDTEPAAEAGGEAGGTDPGSPGDDTVGPDTAEDTGNTPDPEEEDRWCLYEVVPSGGQNLLYVRAEPDPDAAVQYTLSVGETVWGSGTVVNGHRDLNRSLGIPQWALTSMLASTGECEEDDDGSEPPPTQDPLPQGFQLPFPCDQEWRLDSWASNHAPALDMVREPDQHGTDGAVLVAPADGVVNMSFYHDNAGHTIQIDHGERYFTTYIHLQSRAVSVGDVVKRGQQIGAVGKTGPTSNGHPHLHFELAYDANGDGQASWGTSNSERIPPWFDGVEYSQGGGLTYRFVRSNNCD